MPFFAPSDEELGFREPVGAPPAPPQVSDAAALSAAFRQDNAVVSSVRAARQEAFPADPDHNPITVIRGTKYEQRHMSAFLGSQSEAETRAIMVRLDQEDADRETLDAAGWRGTLFQMLAGLADPTIALPGGTIVRGARGGYSFARSAASVGLASAAQATIQEGILHDTHESRTAGESAIAIGSATILGALIGGGAARILSTSERAALVSALDVDRRAMAEHAGAPALPAAAGAAATDARQLELAGALGVDKVPIISQASPTRRVLAGSSIEARRTMADLAETPYRFADNEEGIASTAGPALDRLARTQITGTRVAVADELDRQFGSYRFNDTDLSFPRMRATLQDWTGQAPERLSFSDFKREVAIALQEGDRHAVPQVQEAAQFIRARVFEPWKERAVAAGLLPDGVDARTAESYFQRVYNKERIQARRPEFVNRVVDWLRQDQDTKRGAQQRLAFADAQLLSWNDQVSKLEARLSRLSARQDDLGARFDERAMEVSRAEHRSGVLAERSASLAEDISEIEDFVAAMRREVSDPRLHERLEMIARQAAELRRADRPMTEGQLRAAEQDELSGILTGEVRMAAEIVTGRRKPPAEPSFLRWLVKSGGIEDEGGEVAAAVGGPKVVRGLIIPADEAGPALPGLAGRRRRGFHEIAEQIAAENPGRFHDGLPTRDDIVTWIAESAAGRQPDWWREVRVDPQAEAAASLASALDEAFNRAGVKVRTVRDVAKVLRDERGAVMSLDDLDRIAREIEAAGEGVPISIRRESVEAEHAEAVAGVVALRSLIDRAKADSGRAARRLTITNARVDEAGLAERANRGRLGVLEDRMERADRRRELIEDAIEVANRMRDEVRAKIEAEILAWQGNSGRGAQAAIASRTAHRTMGRPADAPRLRSADAAVSRTVRRILESERDLSAEELRARASEITDRIVGTPDGRLPYDVASGGPQIGWTPTSGESPRGPLAARVFMIPDATIRDFLETDVEKVVGLHLRTMVPDVLLTERFGDTRMTASLRSIMDDYARRIDALPPNSEREATRLAAERDAAIRDIAAVRDRVRGVYGWSADLRNMARFAAGAKAVNNLTSMGMAAVSSFSDAAGAIFRWGFASTFKDGWRPFLAHMMGRNEAFGQFREQMRALGIGTDTVINARQHALDDVLDVYQPQSRFERTLQATSDKFFIVNLLAPETDAMKTVAAHVAVSSILDAASATAAGKATPRQIANLAESGIDAGMARRIADQFATGGALVDGVRLPNTGDWMDRATADALNGAVAREVDIAVVTPGQEKPLWLSHPVISVLGQFKAFTASATERIMIANLQRRDAQALQGLIAAVGLGMISYKVNSMLGGQPTSDRPQDWVKEGISRGGLLGWFEEGNAFASKATRGGVDVYRLLGADKPLSRFASRSAADMLLGPTWGKLEALPKLSGALASGEWKQADTTALRRLMIFQNHFALRGLLNQVEAGANAAFGIPMKERP